MMTHHLAQPSVATAVPVGDLLDSGVLNGAVRNDDVEPARLDEELVARLRLGDESAFSEIVDGWSPMMLRVARSFVSSEASAEEMVQETWLAVLAGLHRFEGRSSLRTWVFRILSNQAKTRGVREARTVPMSSLGGDDADGLTVDADRFSGKDEEYPGHWTDEGAPRAWQPAPESSLLSAEIRSLVAEALLLLPDRQRTVVSLRDVHGLTSNEVCDALSITAANQRVLLHRGRAMLRTALEDYYHEIDTRSDGRNGVTS